MDQLQQIIPLLLVAGGGAYLYSTKCASKSGRNQDGQSNKQSKSSSSKKSRRDDEDDLDIDDEEFLGKKKTRKAPAPLREQDSASSLLARAYRHQAETLAKQQAQEELQKQTQAEKKQALKQASKSAKKAGKSGTKNTVVVDPAAAKKAEKEKKKAAAAEEAKRVAAQKAAAAAAAVVDRPLGSTQLSADDNQDEWTSVPTRRDKKKAAAAAAAAAATISGPVVIETIGVDPVTGAVVDEEEYIEPEPEIEITMRVPTDKVSAIIGKGGVILEEIQTKTHTRLRFPKKGELSESKQKERDIIAMIDGAPQHQRLTIKGTDHACAKAKRIVTELIEQGFSSTLHDHLNQLTVKVEVDQRARVIGAGSAHIKQIQDALQVQIILPPRQSTDVNFIIIGERESTLKAKTAIRQLASNGYSTLTHPTYVKQSIFFDAGWRSQLIGRAGVNIKQLQKSTHTHILFPTKDSVNELYIVGDIKDVQHCKTLIREKIENEYGIEQEELDLQEAQQAYGFQNTSDDEEIDEEAAQYLYKRHQDDLDQLGSF